MTTIFPRLQSTGLRAAKLIAKRQLEIESSIVTNGHVVDKPLGASAKSKAAEKRHGSDKALSKK